MATFIFDEENHRYLVDEVEAPSVTTILKGAGMINTQFYDDYSRDRGTAVHKATELWDRGELDEESLDPVIVPYLAAWKVFCRDSGAEWSMIEGRGYSLSPFFAGTFDRFGTVNGRPTLLDIKTGGKEPWHPLQLAAYVHLLNQDEGYTGPRILARVSVYLADSGTYSTQTYRVGRYHRDLHLFQSALNVYGWKKIHGKLE